MLDLAQPKMQDEVEVIGDSDDLDEVVPLRYSITSYGADYPVDSLVDRINSGAIYVPSFQRGYVWTLRQASRFIESLLLGLPVPGIFLSREQETQKLIVIDGQQRLKTLEFFYEGVFEPRRKVFALDLDAPGINSPLSGLTYRTLLEDDKRHLDDSIIHATVIRQDEPSDGQSSVYNIFERLNTGGVQLEPQEIRASIFHGELSDYLADVNNNDAWRSVFGPKSARMRDQELILRFFALYFARAEYGRPMKEFLNTYMGKNRNLEVQSAETLTTAFVPTVELIANHIGNKAFKPKTAVNAAVFDAVMVGVASRLASGPIENSTSLKSIHSTLLENEDFQTVITRSTADEVRVAARLDASIAAFASIN